MKMETKKIVLMGYMASGKSTVGRTLAEKIKLPFIDLDDYISLEEGISIAKIFDEKGEPYFRKKELLYLEKLLCNEDPFVLAVGGGTPTFVGAIELINKYSISVYLKASIQTLFERLLPKNIERPLLTKIPNEALQEYIAVHLFERNAYYFKSSVVVEIDHKSIDTIVDELVDILKNYNQSQLKKDSNL